MLASAVARAKNLWYGAFINQRWTIGIATAQDGSDSTWITRGRLLEPLHGGNFLADPFVVPGTDGKVLLCEWLETHRGRGVIARVELASDGRIGEIQKLIDWAPYHLSYPHVFRHEGKLYCCPESCHSRSVRLYELTADARGIVGSEEIMSRFASVDPTLFEHEGRWWLLCTTAAQGRSNSHLHAFHAPTLRGPWTPHAGNPIVNDVSTARPAGRVFSVDGRLYRPAQDCSVRYGGGLKLMEIQVLTPDRYAEQPTWSVHPPLGPYGKHGVHTFNIADGVIAYDAYTERFSPLAWLYRLQERLGVRAG